MYKSKYLQKCQLFPFHCQQQKVNSGFNMFKCDKAYKICVCYDKEKYKYTTG